MVVPIHAYSIRIVGGIKWILALIQSPYHRTTKETEKTEHP
jgi:hypothetical protein